MTSEGIPLNNNAFICLFSWVNAFIHFPVNFHLLFFSARKKVNPLIFFKKTLMRIERIAVTDAKSISQIYSFNLTCTELGLNARRSARCWRYKLNRMRGPHWPPGGDKPLEEILPTDQNTMGPLYSRWDSGWKWREHMTHTGLSNKEMSWFTYPKRREGERSVELPHSTSQCRDAGDVTRDGVCSSLSSTPLCSGFVLQLQQWPLKSPSSFLIVYHLGRLSFYYPILTKREDL